MQPLPNFRHLFYFWTIAREGSIKKASRKLNLTPSGLSGQLKQLEEFFGKKLFDRRVRKLVLNDAGKLAFEYCTHLFTRAEEMAVALREHRPQKKILIRVGVLPSLSTTHIHDFILPLWKNKTVSVSVLEGILDDLIFQLDNQELEVVLSDREVETHYRNLVSYRLKPRKIIAVGTQEFAPLKRDFPASLTGVPMIQLTRHSQIRPEIDAYFYKHGVRPQIIGEADDVTLLRLGAERGICVAVLPQNTVQDSIGEGRLIKLGELVGVNSDMWAMARRDSQRLPMVEKTIRKFISES